MAKVYIGDSIYAERITGELILTTENGLPTDPSNKIVFGFEEWKALLKFMEKGEVN